MNDPSIIDWESWLSSPPGQYVLNWEQKQFDRLVADIFGYHALQFGVPQLATLRENRMTFQGLVVDSTLEPFDKPEATTENLDADATATAITTPAPSRILVDCRFDELPFASQSVDLAIMPHALEFSHDPHEVLREIARILMPDGRIILSGFNHFSLWGMRQISSRMIGMPFLPREGQFLSFTRLKDWLKLLGLEVHGGHFGCYVPPYRSDKWLTRTAFMEKAGDRWWPVFGAVYILSAVKRVPGMRLIGPRWKTKLARQAALAPAAAPNVSPRSTSNPDELSDR